MKRIHFVQNHLQTVDTANAVVRAVPAATTGTVLRETGGTRSDVLKASSTSSSANQLMAVGAVAEAVVEAKVVAVVEAAAPPRERRVTA